MPSRRELIQLTHEEMAEFLDTSRTLIIVSNGVDGYPHPVPMWFCRDAEGRLCCTTFKKAQKVLNFRRDPKASLLVESGHDYEELKSVLIYAHADVVEDVDAVRDTLVGINSKGRTVSEAEREELREAVSNTAEKRVMIRFTPQRYVSWDHAKLGGRY
ncbi:MAG: pyridoxamine 5'-phosphate oxidase family protein [Pseudomonadales bacterium]|jgi:nitroimidazol reductase NimA-like FMN-containing flavoprotein (pyridoxamine 5'-phosphate oxidase superfamily)|nr:pyridoxamine 5'-phosphate oxidase family protein [Pseudomonadales bacterium]MDP6470269.1 pyridoxamine 5'-phosphate oxidase family protein [Pseudomonadales bacterium]MDP6827175.1 pyridoxamine 5'-phosphate oxidase family protein [Pseudomonadales bacterium]MDP6972394.1 pyridoxamine 5'-phosphate oxidase family protein [Pseudomonadales bacterium]|tara:strand:+ start:2245 stop:2718 length:474 start_codon:yes stop_codon:yes gene_type:complete